LDLELTGKEREKFGKSFGNDIKEGNLKKEVERARLFSI